MKLYYAPGACSLSPHIVLEELGLEHQLVKVDLKAKRTEDGQDFLEINPKGYVPALQMDGGQILTEGPAIVHYLASLKPEKGIIPGPDSVERFRLLEWLTFIGTELHKNFGPLFSNAPEDAQKAARERLKARLDYTEGQLKGRDFLLGSQFTAADAYLFVILTWCKKMEIAIGPNLTRLRDRVADRPAVQEAMRAEGLLAAAG